MKLKELFYMLGFKPKTKKYGYEVKHFNLSKDGKIEYAQWLHPSEGPKTVDQEKVDELRKFLSPGDVAIDIGAHTGDTTIHMALAVGKSGCVFALEPNEYVFPVLEKNSKLNADKTNIIPLMFAATTEDCKMTFEYSDAGFCNGGFHERISKWRHGHAFNLDVEGKNLEKFLREKHSELIKKLKYIKIDVEGYDCSVIKSITGIIKECRPFLTVEVFRKLSKEQRTKLYKTIKFFGYSIYKIESDYNYKGILIDENNFFSWRHFDVFCTPN